MYQDEASSYALSSGEDSTGEGGSQGYTVSEGGQSYYTQTGEGSSTDMSKYVKSQRREGEARKTDVWTCA